MHADGNSEPSNFTHVDPVALCADTAAGWHGSWLAALGLRSERRESVWRALDAPPFIYWSAITLARDAPSSVARDVHGTLCDSWSLLDLAPFGFDKRESEPWFLRPAGELPIEQGPSDLNVVRVSTPALVTEFESVSMRGFTGDDASAESGTIHPPSILTDARMTMLIGRVEGTAVAAAMSYRGDTAVGVYGVTTLASARERGYASALTRALVDPAAPAVLSPSPESESMYRRLGFEKVGELRQWWRP
jgi:hypothetical protein